MLGALPESDERDVGPLPAATGADVLDVDLTGDHVVAEGDDDRVDEREAVLALVGDQNVWLVDRGPERSREPSLEPARPDKTVRTGCRPTLELL